MTGEGDDIGRLYRAYGRRVYRYCLYRCGSHEDAEDLAAETFARLIRHRPEGDVLPWLLRVAHNLCTDQARRNARRGRPHPRQDVAEVTMPEWPDPMLRRALESLGRPQQQVVWLRVVEDLTFEQVAHVMKKRVGAVKMSYYRALKELRERMEADDGEAA